MALVIGPGCEPIQGYRLVKQLGQGGFGQVWQAQAPGGFDVALKFIRLERDRARGELRALDVIRSIRHANLLDVQFAVEVSDTLIIAMPMCDASLWDRLKQCRAQGLRGIPHDELLSYMLDAARGLDYLNQPRNWGADGHRISIQHRDVKPQNMFLAGGSVRLADFGLAKILEQSEATHTGGMTPAYAPPELFHRSVHEHSDQYSLAVTYYQLRTGVLPFAGNYAQMMFGHLRRVPDLSELPSDERLIVLRALHKDPKKRWNSCAEFVERLRHAALIAVPHDRFENSNNEPWKGYEDVTGDVEPLPDSAAFATEDSREHETPQKVDGCPLVSVDPDSEGDSSESSRLPIPDEPHGRRSIADAVATPSDKDALPAWRERTAPKSRRTMVLVLLGLAFVGSGLSLHAYFSREGRVRINLHPIDDSVRVYIDGEEVQATGSAFGIRAGDHRLLAISPHFGTMESNFRVLRGEETKLEIDLLGLTLGEAPFAICTIRTQPADARIFVDADGISLTRHGDTRRMLVRDAGLNRELVFRASHEGYEDHWESWIPSAGENREILIPLRRTLADGPSTDTPTPVDPSPDMSVPTEGAETGGLLASASNIEGSSTALQDEHPSSADGIAPPKPMSTATVAHGAHYPPTDSPLLVPTVDSADKPASDQDAMTEADITKSQQTNLHPEIGPRDPSTDSGDLDEFTLPTPPDEPPPTGPERLPALAELEDVPAGFIPQDTQKYVFSPRPRSDDVRIQEDDGFQDMDSGQSPQGEDTAPVVADATPAPLETMSALGLGDWIEVTGIDVAVLDRNFQRIATIARGERFQVKGLHSNQYVLVCANPDAGDDGHGWVERDKVRWIADQPPPRIEHGFPGARPLPPPPAPQLSLPPPSGNFGGILPNLVKNPKAIVRNIYQAGDRVVVVVSQANVRFSNRVVGTVSRGQKFVVLKASGKFVRVRVPEGEGWIHIHEIAPAGAIP